MSRDEVRFQPSLFFSSPFGFNSRILSCKPCAYFLKLLFFSDATTTETKKKKPRPSAEYMASLNKDPKIAAFRVKQAQKNAEQVKREAALMEEQEEEEWEEEEENEEEEFGREEEEFERERRQQTSNPKTPGDEEERKTKKRKQKESFERKEGV